MAKRIGNRTIKLENEVNIASYASVVGQKEHEGPLGEYFDKYYEDELFGKDSFEQAESKMQELAVSEALNKSGRKPDDINVILAGDLLNQCIASSYGLRELNIPFIGLYGACSTMALSLSLASLLVEGGSATRAVAVTSSHFCGSERQYRFPLEYGNQRTPTAQWTVTGSGAAVVEIGKDDPKIKEITFGKIVDLGVTDMNNMGAAMAPAAADTIKSYLDDTNTKPEDYDLILTGDLGKVGSELLIHLLKLDKTDISKVHNDCGKMIFDIDKQDVHAGGSGCGCSASVFCSYIMQSLKANKFNNILFCATGALMSPTASMQGESIPGIAHLVHIVS